ncbi:MAG: radical SAM protein [Chloroflexota bacterium]
MCASRSEIVAIPELTPALLPIAELFGIRPPYVEKGLSVRPLWTAAADVGTGLPAGWKELPDADLWAAHASTLRVPGAGPSPSLLELKLELAQRLSSPCRLCQLECGAHREEGEVGLCGAGSLAATRIYRARQLVGETSFLPDGWAIDPAGCNACCVYCHSPWGISARAGHLTSPAAAARQVETLDGIRHVNIVGGESTVHLPWIIAFLLELRRRDLPLVITTNGTGSTQALSLLEGLASVYLLSARLADGCAAANGDVGLTRPLTTLQCMAEQTEAITLVRLLPIPGHVECCAFRWIDELERLASVGVTFRFQLLEGYFPAFRARRCPGLDRPLSDGEKARVRARVAASGLDGRVTGYVTGTRRHALYR